MARPRSFCTDAALDTALDVFWMRGFEATSITDLTEAMGIQRGSLYQAFGDKKSLFLAVLERYLANGRAEAESLLEEAKSPRMALEAWLAKVMTACPSRKGCFAVNATTELSPHDADVCRITSEHWAATEALFVRTIERGQALGEIRSDVPARQLARLLLTSLAGSQVLGRRKDDGKRANASDVAATVTTLFGA